MKTTGLEKARGFFISLLLGHFNHPDTTRGPFVEKALCTFGVSAAPPHWGAGALFISRVSLLLGMQLPGCRLEAVHFRDVLKSLPHPYMERELRKEAIGRPESVPALIEALSVGVPVPGWQ